MGTKGYEPEERHEAATGWGDGWVREACADPIRCPSSLKLYPSLASNERRVDGSEASFG